MKLSVREAVQTDAQEIADLRVAAAADLTARYGKGFWSSHATEKGVLNAMKRGRVLIATRAGMIVGTLTLSRERPWAIDAKYFTRVKSPVYLTSMAVDPEVQRQGVGRCLLTSVLDVVQRWPGDAIRLDAFDAEAGAGAFYARCGYREVGRTVFRGVPLIYYERLLAPGADPAA